MPYFLLWNNLITVLNANKKRNEDPSMSILIVSNGLISGRNTPCIMMHDRANLVINYFVTTTAALRTPVDGGCWLLCYDNVAPTDATV